MIFGTLGFSILLRWFWWGRQQRDMSDGQSSSKETKVADGGKLNVSTNSAEERKEEGHRIDQLFSSAGQLRAYKSAEVSHAVFDTETGYSIVQKTAGKTQTRMGFSKGGKRYLYPEEAAFLVELAQLELKFDGIPMSVQQVHATVLKHALSVSINEYLVYCHFRRLGYIVLRHDPSRSRQADTNGAFSPPTKRTKTDVDDQALSDGDDQTAANNNSKQTTSCRWGYDAEDWPPTTADTTSIANEPVYSQSPRFDQKLMCSFPTGSSRQQISLNPLPERCYPETAKCRSAAAPKQRWSHRAEACRPAWYQQLPRSVLSVGNWTAYQRAYDTWRIQLHERRRQRATGSLCAALTNRDWRSNGRIAGALDVVGSRRNDQPTARVAIKRKSDDGLQCSFDVFLPDVHFKLSDPPSPAFRLVVLSKGANYPNLVDLGLGALQSELKQTAPIQIAFVDGGEIVLHQATATSIPRLM